MTAALTAPRGKSAGVTGLEAASSPHNGVTCLGGLCLFLSTLDFLIPKPLPFMRIGLANLPLLIALASPGFDGKGRPAGEGGPAPVLLFSLKSYCLLVLLKISGQALITGTLFSYVFLFSLAGSLSSAGCMYLLRRFPGPRFLSLAGTGIAGAFVSNAAQLVLARFLVFGESARYLAPPFLVAGVLSGGVLGVFAQAFSERSRWIKHTGRREIHRGKGYPGPDGARSVSGGAEGGGAKETLRLYGALASAALFLLVPWLPLRAALFVLFWAGAAALGKKTRPVLTLSVILTVTAFNLFPPHGKVLASFGPLTITLGALLGGLRRALTLEGLIMLSRLFIRGKVTLPGPFGRLLGESFAVFERLNERNPAAPSKDRTGKKNLVEKLDGLLCGL